MYHRRRRSRRQRSSRSLTSSSSFPSFTLLIHLEQEAAAIKNKKGYIELKSQTNGVHFTTKPLKSLNEEHRNINKAYEKKQSGLVKDVIGIAGSSSRPLGSSTTASSGRD